MSQSPILITGGAQRLGRHCAERLLDDGHPVIVTYRRERDTLDSLRERGAITLMANFSSERGIREFIARLTETTGSLRAIVHNASEWVADPDVEAAGETFERLFQVHMQAPYLINLHARALLEACQEPQRDIIHITDSVVQRGAAGQAAYAATKAGLESLTRSFAAQFAPQIQVNAVAPGLIMSAELGAPVDARRVPGPGVIYQTIRYLLDNDFVTGTVMPVDGGQHLT
ncbi:dihydromonapterin reductase [Salinicola rhizosphaerae]|uniref:Dihydromonapterin reductase n=1 Tax=Salinicola rhizosphaerae TaxID=1443141 RepID=A0ABQ3DY75_9GAMM|nr:dihydromonapterin reductase [Salinicola rhizosphaerae]GHB20255.1 short-chain dehydrogenase [Salinicola rhizosphaerae]